MTFLLPHPLPPDADELLRQACFAGGYDHTPTPTRVQVADGRMVVTRRVNESGQLLVPWRVDQAGTHVTATATLRDRSEPYRLVVELARGKLNQVRTQAAEWQDIGLQTPPHFDRDLADATLLFGRAALNQALTDDPVDPGFAGTDEVAARVLERAYDLADRLARVYADQMFGTRLQEGPLKTRLAARFLTAPSGDLAAEYRRTFNAAAVGVRWRDLEPAESQYVWGPLDDAVGAAKGMGLPLTAGPVIDLTPGMLPEWAAGWEGDLPALAAFMCDFLETVLARYKADVRRWVVCAGFNQADGMGLTDDDRLRLAARLFDAASQLDPELELVLSIAQPWGDYLVNDEQTITPLGFADDLVRAGLRISAVELELRQGVLPRGSLPRDLLDTARLLDKFGGLDGLGLPLEVVLSGPASGAWDPAAAQTGQRLWEHGWAGGPTPEWQAAWGTSAAALALCEPAVRAVTWDHWSDTDPHLTPNGGLVDAAGRVNLLASGLRGLRTAFLASPQ